MFDKTATMFDKTASSLSSSFVVFYQESEKQARKPAFPYYITAKMRWCRFRSRRRVEPYPLRSSS